MTAKLRWERIYSRFVFFPLLVIVFALFALDYAQSWRGTGFTIERLEHLGALIVIVFVLNFVRISFRESSHPEN